MSSYATTSKYMKEKIGKSPVVIFPLKKWEEIETRLENLEDALHFNRSAADPKNKKLISFQEVKKKLKLS